MALFAVEAITTARRESCNNFISNLELLHRFASLNDLADSLMANDEVVRLRLMASVKVQVGAVCRCFRIKKVGYVRLPAHPQRPARKTLMTASVSS